jgi:aromatic ring-opening dioxygenase LigB subunit
VPGIESSPRSTGLVAACVAPHGDLAVPEACSPDTVRLARRTQAGMLELARIAEAAAPDVLVVLTPHGLHVEGHLAVVVASRLAGALAEAPSVALDVPVDRRLSLALLDGLRIAGIPAVGVSYGGNDPAEAMMPLDWGGLIPLWYLGGRRQPPLPVVLVSPARDLPSETHVLAGETLARAVAASGRRSILVASADQAHTHLGTGPYGWDPAAVVYDREMVRILGGGRLSELAAIEPGLIEAAKPDSWWQLLMLAGAIGDGWRATVHSYEAPTYYGMLCATFAPPR